MGPGVQRGGASGEGEGAPRAGRGAGARGSRRRWSCRRAGGLVGGHPPSLPLGAALLGALQEQLALAYGLAVVGLELSARGGREEVWIWARACLRR